MALPHGACVGLQCVIVAFSGHSHFFKFKDVYIVFCVVLKLFM